MENITVNADIRAVQVQVTATANDIIIKRLNDNQRWPSPVTFQKYIDVTDRMSLVTVTVKLTFATVGHNVNPLERRDRRINQSV
jgi:hypothetical protein